MTTTTTTTAIDERDARVAAIRSASELALVPFSIVSFRDIDAQTVTIPAGLYVSLLALVADVESRSLDPDPILVAIRSVATVRT